MSISLNIKGKSWEELEAEMLEKSQGDLDWEHGRHSAFVWHANDEVKEVAKKAYSMFITTNGLGKSVFPSIRSMEEEVIAVVLNNLEGNDAAGHMTSGGTESIFLATMAARDRARILHPEITQPEIVAPFSAHPGINKAAHYLGMNVIRIPTGEDYRADVDAMAEAITANTIMLYSSAPSFPMGIIDPIAELGSLAEERNLWLHVDACVGGILAPYARQAGYDVPAFDFSIPGVTSISADLHKSGFAAKGASSVLFRTQELQEFSRFDFNDWPSGHYSSLTFTGTNPGGAIAAAWAVMNFLGVDGYLDIARTVMEAKNKLAHGIAEIDGLHVWGQPELWALAYGSSKVNMLSVCKKMWGKGWMVAPNKQPPGIHFMMTPVHEPIIDDYLLALAQSVQEVESEGSSATPINPKYN
jgi:sphinganine-1-phosphate aldolase